MGFKERWSHRNEAAMADMAGFAASTAQNAYKANSALNTLYASDYGYDEWKNIGISFKAAGGEKSDWLAWCSVDAANYDERVASRLYDSVDAEGEITANTLWKLAWNAGWEWHERFERAPTVKMVPKPIELESGDMQAITQLEAMFGPDELVNIVTKATLNNKGKLVPSGYGFTRRRSELCDAIREHGLDSVLGGYDRDAGVWLRINPMKGSGISDTDVAACRYALVESDDMPLKEQERMLFELNLPIVCITDSGGKSLHAVVEVDADGRNHFNDRVRYMHDECARNGMTIDSANKNPSRLTRLAGVMRGGREQTLLHTATGARDFASWMREKRSVAPVYDHGIEPMDMTTPIVLDEVLIDGIMRRGDKMCVAGASKSYKTFSLIQLAIAMACGTRWFGWQCTKGRVLYINYELRSESFRSRVWEIARAMGASAEDIAGNMDVWNMRGRTQPLETSKDHIIAQASERGYDLIVLDPIYKPFAGDENSAEDVSNFMLAMDELAMRLNASVAYCHHHSKGAKGGVSAQDRFSGSGVFARDCDELIDISPLDLKDHSITEWGFDDRASAWRVETVIRDFAPKPPLDVVFEYPLHHVDSTGSLSEFSILSPQSVGGSKRGEQQQAERDRNIDKLERWCIDHYKFDTRALTASELSEVFEKSPRTIVGWANRSDSLRVEKVGSTNTVVLNHRKTAS